MQAVNPHADLSPLLHQCDRSLFLKISEQLASPINPKTIEHCLSLVSNHFNKVDLVLGIVTDNNTFLRLALYQQCNTSLTIDNCSIELSHEEGNTLKQSGASLTPRNDKPLFLKITQNFENGKALLSKSLTQYTFPVLSQNNDPGYGYIALSSSTHTVAMDSSSELLAEVWDLLSASICNLQSNKLMLKETKKLNDIINFSQSIYTTWNEKDGWHYHNVNGLVNLGFKKEDIDITWLQKHNPMHPDDWNKSLLLFNNLIRKGIDYQHEYRTVGPNGETHWYFSVASAAEKNSRGGASQTTSISREITSLKQAEFSALDALQREQWLVKQTHQIFNSADFQGLSSSLKLLGEHLQISRCAVRVIDPETKRCNLVAEWHRANETSLAELFPEMTSQTGIGWIERLINLGDAYVVNHIEKEVPNKKLLDYHRAINTKATLTQPMIVNGELIGYLAVLDSEPHFWSDTEIQITQVIADTIHMTITRNRLLEDLRESQARTQLAMQDSTYSLWDHNLRDDKLFLSPHFYSALGYDSHQQFVNSKFALKLTHTEDRKELLRAYKEQTNSKTGEIALELRLKRNDGSYSWILMRGKVVERDLHGRPLQVMGINMEINQLKETLTELKLAQEKAEEANQSKSEFLERMSHEIRTPMNAILGMSYLALDTALHKDQYSHLEDIENAAKSLLHIIDDILDFSKIESGELSINKEKFDIHVMIKRLLKLFSVRAEQSGNELQFNITDEIPQHMIGDPNRVGQVLTNLLSNALKFTKSGTVSISVQVAEVDNKQDTISLLFSVSDSGIGLNEQQLKNLFDPFTQAEGSTTRKYGGTGLGLSICKHLVEMMGGSIHAISLPNVGTTFHFTIVFNQYTQLYSQTQNHRLPNTVISEVDIPQIFAGKKVLLTEDNIVNQRVAIGILKKFQIETVTANNGQEALFILYATEAEEFDAILMDIEMPVLDGLETAKAIRMMPNFAKVPIIAMTAHAMVGDKERCIEVGMNDHIPKPINPKTLLRSLAQIWSPGYDNDKHLNPSSNPKTSSTLENVDTNRGKLNL